MTGTRSTSPGFSLAGRIAEVRGELATMRAKQCRLNAAIAQKETHLLRLEASRAMCCDRPEPDTNDE